LCREGPSSAGGGWCQVGAEAGQRAIGGVRLRWRSPCCAALLAPRTGVRLTGASEKLLRRGIRTLDPEQVLAEAMGGGAPRLWIRHRTCFSAEAVSPNDVMLAELRGRTGVSVAADDQTSSSFGSGRLVVAENDCELLPEFRAKSTNRRKAADYRAMRPAATPHRPLQQRSALRQARRRPEFVGGELMLQVNRSTHLQAIEVSPPRRSVTSRRSTSPQ
jgi:hypothetical protein